MYDLTRARKLNNYVLDATGGGLFTSTTRYRVTVPPGKRWILLGGIINRDNSSTLSIYLYDVDDNIIGRLLQEAAGTGIDSFPEEEWSIGTSWVLDPGEYIESIYGTAQGVAAYHTCVVLEVSI